MMFMGVRFLDRNTYIRHQTRQSMTFTDHDKKCMLEALEQARISFARDQFPVGATLSIDDALIGGAGNANRANKDWSSHAENSLIKARGPKIQAAVKKGSNVTVYTTLEPCLQCLGTVVLNRISRIVYACRDPNGGATAVDPATISNWYVRKWPLIEKGLLASESYELLTTYMRVHQVSWGRHLKDLEELRKTRPDLFE